MVKRLQGIAAAVFLAALHTLSDWWEWTTHDPIGFYTSLLALFTFALVVVSSIQIRYLIRADMTARISADAARQAANAAERALTDRDRPWIFVEGATITRRELPGTPLIPNNFFISFRCRNIGRTPAIIEECVVKFEDKTILAGESRRQEGPQYDPPKGASR